MSVVAPVIRDGHPSDTHATSAPAGVPWWTVVPLAALMAYGDGFWVISLREAAGAIERVDSPFATWLREATIVLPVFVLAVVAAVAIALPRLGPAPRRARPVIVVGLLVVAAGTVAGVACLVASSAYDYHLQSVQMAAMNAMDGTCTAACESARQRSSLELQVRSVGYGSGLILVTNLVLVAWAIALRGGQVNLGRRVEPAAPAPSGRGKLLRSLLAVGLVGSAAIHAAVVPEHLAEWPAAGTFFVVLTIGELALGLAVLVRLTRPVLVSAAGVSAVALLLWLSSRTVGLPVGPEPWTPEAVGLADVVCCLLEVVTLIAAVALLLRSSRPADGPAGSPHTRALAVLCLVSVTAIGLGATDVTWLHAFGVAGESMHHAG